VMEGSIEVGEELDSSAAGANITITDDEGQNVENTEDPGEELEGTVSDDELDGGVKPSGYSMSVSKSRVLVNEAFTWKSSMRGANYGYLHIKCGNNEVYCGKVYNGRSYSFKIADSGTFRFYLVLYNSYGSFNGYYANGGSLYVTAGYAPSGYSLSYSSSSVYAGQSVTYNLKKYNATKAKAVVLRNGRSYASDYVGDCFRVNFSQTGTYKVYLILYNDFGSFDGSKHNGIHTVTVKDGKPTAYSMSLSATSVKVGSSVDVNCNTNRATSATVVVTSNGRTTASKTFTGLQGLLNVNINFPETGKYGIYLITKNAYGSYNGKSNAKYITVTGSAPSGYYMSISTNSAKVGDTITLNINAYEAKYYYICANQNGSLVFKEKRGLDTRLDLKITQAGTYVFYLITYNDYGSYNGLSKGKTLTCVVSDSTTSTNNYFKVGRNTYSFTNSSNSFGYPTNYKMPLSQYISVLGYTNGYNTWRNAGNWGGSCYGMASSSLQFYLNNLSIRTFSSTASNLYSIVAPRSYKTSLTKMIERYQLSQMIGTVSKQRSSNRNNFSGLINAVNNFSSTGKNPVIIGVYRNGGGHALVGLSCGRDSSGNYRINVYDCNYPTKKDRHITISKNLKSFSYNGGSHTYSYYLDYSYASTVYSAMPNGARSKSLDGSDGEDGDEGINGFRIAIKADDYDIVNSSGVKLADIDGAYRIDNMEMGEISDFEEYVLPVDNYELTYKNDLAEDEVELRVYNDIYYNEAEASGTSGKIEFGNVGTTDRLICNVIPGTACDLSISTLNDAGVMQYFEVEGTKLGVANVDTNSFEAVSSEGYVYQNGAQVSLGGTSSGGNEELDGSSASNSNILGNNLDDFDTSLDGSSGIYDYNIYERSNLLELESGVVNGSVGVVVSSDSSDLTEAVGQAAIYDADGKLVSITKKDIVLGTGKTYIDFDVNPGEIKVTGDVIVKVMLWNEDMYPLAEQLEFVA
ncbi:MAG: hypothetical protein ACI4A5_00615, partial [Hominilimicola sp.]